MHRNGRFAAVTNYTEAPPEPMPPRSRGELVWDFLAGDGRPGALPRRDRGARRRVPRLQSARRQRRRALVPSPTARRTPLGARTRASTASPTTCSTRAGRASNRGPSALCRTSRSARRGARARRRSSRCSATPPNRRPRRSGRPPAGPRPRRHIALLHPRRRVRHAREHGAAAGRRRRRRATSLRGAALGVALMLPWSAPRAGRGASAERFALAGEA